MWIFLAQDDAGTSESPLLLRTLLYLVMCDLMSCSGHRISFCLQGEKCCSDHPISFHYIEPRYMYELEYWLYHAAVLGRATENIPWPKIAK